MRYAHQTLTYCYLEHFNISGKMEKNDPPPPYSASPYLPPADSGTYSSPTAPKRESVHHSLVHQPGSSRSSFNPLHSSAPTQADSIRGYSQPPHTGPLSVPPIADHTTYIRYIQPPPSHQSGVTQADSIRGFVPPVPTHTSNQPRATTIQRSVSPAPIRSSRPTQADSIRELTHQPGTSRSSFNAKQNVVIIPRQPIPPATSYVQQSGVSSSFTTKENAVIIKPARQPSPSLIQQSGASSSFVVDPPPSFAQATSQNNHRFPKDFGFYHASGSMSDMVIALRGDDPNPLFYISTHRGLSSKPSIILHSNRYPTSPPLATADYHTYTSSIDIVLSATSSYRVEHHHLEKSGVFSSGRVFSVTLPGSNVLEGFEWKRSQGQEVASLHGRGHGEKLVRVSTGEVVAAWTTPYMSIGKKGKMSFLGNREVLGEKFELMAVICMLGIMAKDHSGSRHGGGAQFGGGGAAMMGGAAAGGF